MPIPKVVVNAMPNSSVRAAACRFSDERSALQHFQVVAELLGAGKSRGRGQDVDRLVCKIVSGNR